jgi:RHS repeat-associated protein
VQSTDKVTEEFTGKELDDETGLNYFGARYYDPMIGIWNTVDLMRFFASPYVYMGNGHNPIRFFDLTGMIPGDAFDTPHQAARDWGAFINPQSKSLNVEFFAFIYKNNEGKFIAANPTMGTVDGFSVNDMQRNRIDNPLLQDFQVTGMIHTHGADTEGYNSELFSTSGDNGIFGDKDLSTMLMLPFYLMPPSDNLKMFDPVTEDVTYPE